MKTTRSALSLLAAASVFLVVVAAPALAQSVIDPAVEPERNTGGWIYGLAWLLGGLAFLVVLAIIFRYMRYAPRFAKDEETAKVVRADRVLPGKEAPRRAVDLSQSVPIVVQPPAIPAAVGAPAPTAAAPTAAAPAAAAPAPAAPAAPAPAPAAEAPPAPPPSPSPAPAAEEPRPEVSLDQEVFEKTLEELLAAGTDRRIAEGKARRAAMIAARKKAAGEG